MVFNNDNKELKRFQGDGGAGHQANFIKAVRSRKTDDRCALDRCALCATPHLQAQRSTGEQALDALRLGSGKEVRTETALLEIHDNAV